MEGMQANPAQIKKYLKQLTNSREQYINYLGQLAYQEYQEGSLPNPKLQEACSTLDEIAGQVTKWEQDLAAIEQMKQAARNPRCAYCGVPLSKGAPFCASCGKPATPMAAAPMPAAPAPVPAAAMGKPCASCGGSLASDATFCTFCGKPVAADAAPQQPAAPAPPAPAPAPVAEPAPAPAPVKPAAASGSLTCSTCGKSYDDPDAVFCTDCGNKMR